VTYFGTCVPSKYSEICGVTEDGETFVRTSIPTTEASVRRFFGKLPAAKVIFECGPVGPWFGRLLHELGHEAIMVSPRRLRLIAESTLKTDRADAEILARVGRLDLGFLRPVYQAARRRRRCVRV
jgi:transposase